MNARILLTLAAFLLCDAKPGLKQNTPNGSAIQSRPGQDGRGMDRYATRQRRGAFDSKTYESSLTWAHSERLDDNGDVVLRWATSDSKVTFRLEAKTRGYVGLGFGTARNMRGADLVVAWVDDRNGNAQILVSRLSQIMPRHLPQILTRLFGWHSHWLRKEQQYVSDCGFAQVEICFSFNSTHG